VNLWQRHDRQMCYRCLISCPLFVKCKYISVSNIFIQFRFFVRHCLCFPPFSCYSFNSETHSQCSWGSLNDSYIWRLPWRRLSWIIFRGNAGIISWACNNARRRKFCDSFRWNFFFFFANNSIDPPYTCTSPLNCATSMALTDSWLVPGPKSHGR
jgi:hypothetical protein